MNNNNNNNNRSRSVERSGASDFADRSRGRSRGRSVERSLGSNNDNNKDRGRVRSKSVGRTLDPLDDYLQDIEDVNPYANDMPVVATRRERSRSRSIARSRATDHASNRGGRGGEPLSSKSEHKSRPQANQPLSSKSEHKGRPSFFDSLLSKSEHRGRSTSRNDDFERERSLSLENSRANDFANKKAHRSSYRENPPVPTSYRQTQPSEPAYRSKPSRVDDNRGRSREAREPIRGRSREPQEPTRGRSRDRSLSLERSKANAFAQRPRPSNSINLNGRSHQPGRKLPDLSTTVTVNADGSVTVAKKRARDDGAIVTTKIKYISVELARKHGIDV